MDKINTKLPYEGCCVSRQGGRSENQDTCGYVDTPYGLLVVICDGMGGGPGGKTASMLGVEVILKTVKNFVATEDKIANRKDILKIAIQSAELAIINYQDENPSVRGMGTTVVAILLNEESAIIAHVGDSRCYQLRFGRKKFRTEDHSFVGNLVREGRLTEEQARLSSQSNIITRALSGRVCGEPTIDIVGYEKGDRFILCTDGVWGSMPERKLLKRMAEKNNLPFLAEKLAADIDALGNQNGGGHDNLTLSIIKTKGDSKYKEPMTRKYRIILICLSIISILCVFYGFFLQCSKVVALNAKDRQIEILQEKLAIKNKEGDISLEFVEGCESPQKEIQVLTAQKDSLVRCLEKAKRTLKEFKENNENRMVAKVSVVVQEKDFTKDLEELNDINKIIKSIKEQKTKEAKKTVKKVLSRLKCLSNKYSKTSVGKNVDDIIKKLGVSCATDESNKNREGQLNSAVKSMEKAINDLKNMYNESIYYR